MKTIHFFHHALRPLLFGMLMVLIFKNMSAQQKPVPTDSTTLIGARPVTMGTFSNRIQHNKKFRHDLQVVSETTTSAFLLTLNPDQSASLCRGWRYDYYNDGVSVQNSENIREQLGYRGKWEQNGSRITIQVTRNDENCEQVGEYSNLVPNHAESWTLQCFPVHIEGVAGLDKRDLMLCHLEEGAATFGEGEPHCLRDIVLEGNWMILGAGNGVQFVQTENSLSEENSVQIAPAAEKINHESWKEPLSKVIDTAE